MSTHKYGPALADAERAQRLVRYRASDDKFHALIGARSFGGTITYVAPQVEALVDVLLDVELPPYDPALDGAAEKVFKEALSQTNEYAKEKADERPTDRSPDRASDPAYTVAGAQPDPAEPKWKRLLDLERRADNAVGLTRGPFERTRRK